MEKLKGFGEKCKAALAKLSKRTRVIIGCAIGALLLGAIIVAIILNTRPYAVLFTGLSSEETTSIATYLNENGVSFQVEGTDTILVPEAQEAQLKANLLVAGYPSSGFAYETYRAGVGSMSTDSDRQMAYLQDLQDRMAAVIRCMDGVQEAVVTIAQGEDRRYVLDSGNTVEASAAVQVTMKNGAALPEQLSSAIRSLVAHAVQGLTIENIYITDSMGNTYTSAGGVTGAADASQLKLQLEAEVNNKVRAQIMTVLAPVYGIDNVRVAVNTTVDVNHTLSDSTQYADGSTDGEGIIGTKIYDQEVIRGDDGAVGGVVGNETNADIDTYMENQVEVDGSETYIRNQGEIHNKVDASKTQVERVAGVVADMMVSVSINSAASGAVNTSELLGHVARAAGITADDQANKISILLAPFYSQDDGIVPPVPGLNLPPWAVYAAIAGAVVLLLLLLLLSILRGKRKKKLRKQQAEMESALRAVRASAVEEPDEPLDLGADIMNLKTEKSIQLRQEIRKFAEENPEMAAQLLRNWLRGGDDDG